MFVGLLGLLLLPAPVVSHDVLPINPILGVPGFPDCFRGHPQLQLTVEEAARDLVCEAKEAPRDAIKIACIGDSITAGVHSTGGNHTYPGQLQIMLDDIHGNGKYSVTNLGACGSTMLKAANSPYWQRPQYKALTAGQWDIVTIMLGTNDAKDPDEPSGGSDNWLHNCGGADHTSLQGCTFAEDYKSMIDVVRKLGTTPVGPKIYAVIPPPLMAEYSIGANQTVINSVYPKLVPLIQKANEVLGPIDVFGAMGGVSDWQSKFPPNCRLNSSFAPCGWWCDAQSCDQCHPNNAGYHQLASVLLKGLGLDKADSVIV